MYTHTQDDFSGVIVRDTIGRDVATITGCTDEFLRDALAAPALLEFVERVALIQAGADNSDTLRALSGAALGLLARFYPVTQ